MRYILLCLLLISSTIFGQEEERIKAEPKPWILDQLLNQGLSAQKEGKHERAIKDLKLGLKVFNSNKLKYPKEYADFLEAHTVSSLALGNNIKGLLKKYKEVLGIREKLNNTEKLSSTHLNISNYYIKTNNYSLAKEHAKQAFDYVVSLKDSGFKFKVLEEILRLNLNKESNEYLKKYINLKDGLVEENTIITNKINRCNYLNSKKDKVNAALKTDKINIEKKVSNQRKISLIIGLLGVVMLLVVIAFFVINQKKLKSQISIYKEKNIAFKELNNNISNRLLNTRENLDLLHVSVDEKKLNKYIFHLRELENIEMELKQKSNRL